MRVNLTIGVKALGVFNLLCSMYAEKTLDQETAKAYIVGDFSDCGWVILI